MALGGPPMWGIRVKGSIVGHAGPGRCTDDGNTTRLTGNAAWLPYDIADGMADELVPYASVLEQINGFDAAGMPYRFTTYPAADHLGWSLQDDWSSEIDHLGHP